MKHFVNLFGWTVVLVIAVFIFIFSYQKQQNEHNERMVENAVNQAQQKQEPAIQIVRVEEQKSLKERMKDGLKSAIAFLLSVFTKL